MSPSRKRLEALLFGLFACLPLWPYAWALFTKPVPRFVLHGDFAALEAATHFVPSGTTLLGAYSRFGFNHPGPLYFYLTWPVYRAFGETPTGLYAGALFVNALAIAASVAALRLASTRAHAIGACLAITAWIAAFGDLTPVPWNPLTVALILTAFLVLAACFATGHLRAAPPAAFFGAFATQTHLSVGPTVAVVFVVASAAHVMVTRANGTLRKRPTLRALAAVGAVILVTSLPMLVEQVVEPEGNLTKLAKFFGQQKGPTPSVGTAAAQWMYGTAQLVGRVYDKTVATEGGYLHPMASTLVPETPDGLSARASALWLTGTLFAIAVAVRRRDKASVALSVAGLLSAAMAILSLSRVVGESMRYLVFWTTATALLGWIGIAATIASAVRDHLTRVSRRARTMTQAAVLAAVLTCVDGTTALQHAWVESSPMSYYPIPGFEDAYKALLARIRETGATPVIHADGAWHFSLYTLNELRKDGITSAIEDNERYLFGRHYPRAGGVTRPIHVYPSVPRARASVHGCLEVLRTSEEIEVRVGPSAVGPCDAPAP